MRIILGEYSERIFWEDFLGGFFGRKFLFILLKSTNVFECERE